MLAWALARKGGGGNSRREWRGRAVLFVALTVCLSASSAVGGARRAYTWDDLVAEAMERGRALARAWETEREQNGARPLPLYDPRVGAVLGHDFIVATEEPHPLEAGLIKPAPPPSSSWSYVSGTQIVWLRASDFIRTTYRAVYRRTHPLLLPAPGDVRYLRSLAEDAVVMPRYFAFRYALNETSALLFAGGVSGGTIKFDLDVYALGLIPVDLNVKANGFTYLAALGYEHYPLGEPGLMPDAKFWRRLSSAKPYWTTLFYYRRMETRIRWLWELLPDQYIMGNHSLSVGEAYGLQGGAGFEFPLRDRRFLRLHGGYGFELKDPSDMSGWFLAFEFRTPL